MHNISSSPLRKYGFFTLLNIAIAISLLAAVPLLRAGQERYEPHANVDKNYVQQVISTGQTEEVGLALKLTEISRAGAYNDYSQMLTIMQFVAVLLALMIIGNLLIMARMLKPEPKTAPVPLKILHAPRQ